jgi:hypothetical protein
LLTWQPASAGDHEDLHGLEKSLRRTCSGKALLHALDADPEGLEIEMRLLTRELERAVEEHTGLLVASSDPELLESVRVLKRLPRRSGCNPEAALMGLIDEWVARATDTNAKRDRAERFIEKMRKNKMPRREPYDEWLKLRFPVLFEEARSILAYLG